MQSSDDSAAKAKKAEHEGVLQSNIGPLLEAHGLELKQGTLQGTLHRRRPPSLRPQKKTSSKTPKFESIEQERLFKEFGQRSQQAQVAKDAFTRMSTAAYATTPFDRAMLGMDADLYADPVARMQGERSVKISRLTHQDGFAYDAILVIQAHSDISTDMATPIPIASINPTLKQVTILLSNPGICTSGHKPFEELIGLIPLWDRALPSELLERLAILYKNKNGKLEPGRKSFYESPGLISDDPTVYRDRGYSFVGKKDGKRFLEGSVTLFKRVDGRMKIINHINIAQSIRGNAVTKTHLLKWASKGGHFTEATPSDPEINNILVLDLGCCDYEAADAAAMWQVVTESGKDKSVGGKSRSKRKIKRKSRKS
jgi:hypothetical protein